MELEVRVEENDEIIVETDAKKSCLSPSLPKHVADPVVYKLVRLEGDGRLVPATDDEIIKVESLLVDGSEMHNVADDLLDVGCNAKEEPSSRMLPHENLEGSLQTVDIGKGLDNGHTQLEASGSSLASTLVESDINQSESSGDCGKIPDKLTEGALTTSVTVISNAQPDFSMLKGEICLDNQSIKELHETYRATFGRETTVKDKLWLKRRITMGLTNSCDVLTTSFVIKDNKLVKENVEGSSNNTDGRVSEDLITGQPGGNLRDITVMYYGQVDDYHVSERNLRNHRIYDGFGGEDHTEQGTSKRVRKPTKRYIEELSEAESKESSKRLTGLDKNPHVRPSRNVSLDESPFITKLDSREGFDILVPRVHRVRRSRPKKDFMALLKFDRSNMDMMTMPVKKSLGEHGFNPVNEIGTRDIQGVSVLQQLTDKQEQESQVLESIAVPVAHDVGLKQRESSHESDNNTVAVPTSKSGIRRKHHRAWTLSEVKMLVDGVSRYGAGKWSEIKRFTFASSSYRTSVDLKDKWRNLLKASLTQTPTDKGTNVRKSSNGPIPIPAPILLKVRELSGLHQQIPTNVSSSKMAETTEIYVQERQSGFL